MVRDEYCIARAMWTKPQDGCSPTLSMLYANCMIRSRSGNIVDLVRPGRGELHLPLVRGDREGMRLYLARSARDRVNRAARCRPLLLVVRAVRQACRIDHGAGRHAARAEAVPEVAVVVHAPHRDAHG